jgi:hypothetical protein
MLHIPCLPLCYINGMTKFVSYDFQLTSRFTSVYNSVQRCAVSVEAVTCHKHLIGPCTTRTPTEKHRNIQAHAVHETWVYLLCSTSGSYNFITLWFTQQRNSKRDVYILLFRWLFSTAKLVLSLPEADVYKAIIVLTDVKPYKIHGSLSRWRLLKWVEINSFSEGWCWSFTSLVRLLITRSTFTRRSCLTNHIDHMNLERLFTKCSLLLLVWLLVCETFKRWATVMQCLVNCK